MTPVPAGDPGRRATVADLTSPPRVDLSTRTVGRIPVLDVTPRVDDGRRPAKAVVGEAVPVEATVFREGHDAVSATAVLTAPDGTERARVTMV